MGLRALESQHLEAQYWDWRTVTAPDTSDDLPRLTRPPGWIPDWSPAAVERRREAVRGFQARYEAIDSTEVDAQLLGCAIARAHWELELIRGWQTNPGFYLDQTLGTIFILLLEPEPPRDEIVLRLHAIPETLAHARSNLDGHAAAPFARAALGHLAHAPADLMESMKHLAIDASAAAEALTDFREWLSVSYVDAPVAVGAEAFDFFLRKVALLPYPAEEIVAMGRQEWTRAVATEAILKTTAGSTLPATAAQQVEAQAALEKEVRRHYVQKGLLSQPDSLRPYTFAPRPDYLKPLSWLGVTDNLVTGVRYIPDPRPGLPYFDRAAAEDPRLAIAHEGVHAQQMALSWQHPNPTRRRFYDSTPNEGIAFYNEELMFLSGLFDDNPRSRATIASFLRLRALRVEADVALALGRMTIDQAAHRLATLVPVDEETAWQEAVFFAGNPGQAMSYLVGKQQILALLAEAGSRPGFDLMSFHDRLWLEGNVPLALQRLEIQ